MDLTPIYLMIGLMVAVFSFGLIIIDHKPIRCILLVMMAGALYIGFDLHDSTRDRRTDAANQQTAQLAKCHSNNLDSTQTAEICGWSSK